VHDAFVGREIELAFLRDLLGEARGGVPRVVLLNGTVGIGKTSLLRQFLVHAEDHCVLRGSGEEMEVGLRYGVVEQLVADVPEPLPERVTILRTDGRTKADPVRVGAEVVDLLGELQANGPVTVVVDDTQWADEASLETLAFALRRLRAHRVLVLLAARDDALERLPASLHRLVAGAAGVMMRLGGLEVPDLRALSLALGTGPLSRRAAARLHRHTGGNPLYTRALLEELSPTILQHNWQPLPAPQRFRTLVLARLAACPPAAERLVTAAAVLGTPCPLPLAAHLAEVEDPLAALEHAIANRMLEERRTAIDLLVSFPHPLVHATVYHDIGPSRRAALHANAAQLVEDEAAAIRHRVAAASGPDPDLAEELAVLASRQVGVGAWTAAADSLLAAARLTATRGERAQFVLNAVDHLLAGGCATEAATLGGQLESFADSGRRDYALARLAMAEGRELEAERLLVRAWRHRDSGTVDPVLSATIAEQLALHTLVRAQGQQAVIWARRAMAAGPSDPAPSHLLDILMIGLVLAGRAPEALATTTSVAVPTPEQRGRLDGLTGGGVARLWTDDLFGARRDLVAARAAYHR
jgi:AAA ATPase domain